MSKKAKRFEKEDKFDEEKEGRKRERKDEKHEEVVIKQQREDKNFLKLLWEFFTRSD
jgi:hypothetical protein